MSWKIDHDTNASNTKKVDQRWTILCNLWKETYMIPCSSTFFEKKIWRSDISKGIGGKNPIWSDFTCKKDSYFRFFLHERFKNDWIKAEHDVHMGKFCKWNRLRRSNVNYRASVCNSHAKRSKWWSPSPRFSVQIPNCVKLNNSDRTDLRQISNESK